MFKIGYKVVNGAGQNWRSAVIGQSVAYRRNQWTRPQKGNGPLAVFEKRLLAETFLEGNASDAIFQVVYEPSREKSIWIRDEQSRSLDDLPYGTRLAKRVMLLKKERTT